MMQSEDTSSMSKNPGQMLPDELQHESVIGSRNRCEPKFDCYHVILDTEKIPVMYRAQWKDDWEILGATIESYDGEARLRLSIIERVETKRWKPYAIPAVGAAILLAYMRAGDFLLSSGRMGETAHLIGTGITFVGLVAVVSVLAAQMWRDYNGQNAVSRP